ncbi:MAG: ABC transporter substrate-binding protein [Coprobacillaceae bacterium]
MKKRLFLMLCSTLFVFGLTGCSNDSEDSNKDEVETMTVTDAKGEVVIPKDPKRIVDISGNSDILSILGYEVVGTANSDAYDYTKYPTYLEDTLDGAEILGYSMQDTMDIEGIIALSPDLIIISNVQEKMYDQLSEVAPTVMLEMAQMNWRDDIYSVAKIFDKEKEAEAWLADYDEKAEEVSKEIKDTYGEDKTYLSFLASGGQLYIFEGAGIGSVMYDDLGLQKPGNMPAQENISLPVVTYEGLAEIDPDYIFVVGTEDDLQALEDNSLWQGMRAVKEGNYISLPASPYFNIGYSCVGRSLFLDEMKTHMADIHE